MKFVWPGTTILLLVSAGVFAALLFPRLMQVHRLEARRGELEKQIALLRKENSALEKELRMLRDDPVYLEKIAREKFNKAKEGEIVYKVIRDKSKATS